MKKLRYFIVLFYFIFYFVGFEISKGVNIYGARIVGIFPALLFIALYIIWRAMNGKGLNLVAKGDKLFFYMVLLYLALHIRSNSIYSESVSVLFTNSVILLVHSFFFYLVFSTCDDVNYLRRTLRYFYAGLLLTFFIAVFVPLNWLGTFTLGGHYDVLDESFESIPFALTTLDAPFLSSLAFGISLSFLLEAFRSRGKTGPRREVLYYFLIFVVVIASAVEMLLINRRGSILSIIILLPVVISPSFFARSKVTYLYMLLMFIPFIWLSIIEYIIPVFQSGVLKSIFINTDIENLSEASGRVFMWGVAILYILNFGMNADYFFGAGILPEYEKLERFGHAHNGLLEAFVQTGVAGVFLLLTLIVMSKEKYKAIYKLGRDSIEFGILFLIFLFTVVSSMTESFFFSNYFTHLLFLSVVIITQATKRLLLKEEALLPKLPAAQEGFSATNP